MIEILICVLFGYKNSNLAKSKGYKGGTWALLTVLSFFLFYLMATGILVMGVYKGPKDQVSLMKFVMANPLRLLLVWVIGAGGCLFIRYILERLPNRTSK